MPTDLGQFLPSAAPQVQRPPLTERSESRGFFTACRLTTEVFTNAAARQPFAALTGWIPCFTPPALLRRAAPRCRPASPSVPPSRAAHA